jgi:ubiquitin-conjugating enzyme E2 variant
VKLKCGPRYPDQPPHVQFINKIVMSGVDMNNGVVNYSAISGKAWNRQVTMYDYLCRLREAMVNAAKTKQPNPEETFPN